MTQWVSRAPPNHTLPAFLNLNGIKTQLFWIKNKDKVVFLFIKINLDQVILLARIPVIDQAQDQLIETVNNIEKSRLKSATSSPAAKIGKVNRYKRGLETCPQANLHQSGRDYFRLGAESYSWLERHEEKLASTLVQIRLYQLKWKF